MRSKLAPVEHQQLIQNDWVASITSTSIETARWTLIETGGSRARARTSSIDDPSLIFMILILKARSDKLSRIISGRGWSAI